MLWSSIMFNTRDALFDVDSNAIVELYPIKRVVVQWVRLSRRKCNCLFTTARQENSTTEAAERAERAVLQR